MFVFLYLLLALIAGTVLGSIAIPQIIRIAFQKKLFDIPNSRKVHKEIIPRLGGLAFAPTVMMVLGLISAMDELLGLHLLANNLDSAAVTLSMGVSAGFMLYALGAMDDLVGVSYRGKFLIQVLVATMMVSSGICLDSLHGLFGVYAVSWYVGMPLSILLMVYMINAMNLIDGIDGLCSGLSMVASLSFLGFFVFMQSWMMALITATVLGVLVPFFYLNLWGTFKKKRRVFMGDTGSLSMGLLLVIMAIKLSMRPAPTENQVDINIVQAFSFVFVPFMDVVWVMGTRVYLGKGLFTPDKNHIHHKFMRSGLRPRVALVSILTMQLMFIAMTFILSVYLSINWVFAILLLAWGLVNLTLHVIITKTEAKEVKVRLEEEKKQMVIDMKQMISMSLKKKKDILVTADKENRQNDDKSTK